MSRHAWMDDAACLGLDVNLFFPEPGDRAGREAAIRVCNQCPVKARCAEAGRGEAGIWGGLTGKQRIGAYGFGRVHAPDTPRRPGLTGICAYTTEPIIGSTRRLRALLRHGYGCNEIARLIQARGHHITHSGVALIRDGAQDFTTPERAKAIRDVYEQYKTRYSTSIRAEVTMRHAAGKGYAAPEDWAGIDIDDPQVRPHAWRFTG